MFIWYGIIGKLVEFSIDRIEKQHINLTNNQRKQVASAFVNFHESLYSLEKKQNTIIKYLTTFKNGNNSKIYFTHAINNLYNEPKLWNNFVNTFAKFGQLSEQFDQQLQELISPKFYNIKHATLRYGHCFNLYSFLVSSKYSDNKNEFKKFFRFDLLKEFDAYIDSIWRLTPRLDISRHEKFFCHLELNVTDEDFLEIDFNSLCDLPKEPHLGDSYVRFTNTLSPLSESLIGILEKKTRILKIDFQDIDSMVVLLHRAELNQKSLQKGRIKLQNYIIQNFSIHDLIFSEEP